MKKTAILLIIAMVLSLFTACGETETAKEVPTRELLGAAMELFSDDAMKSPTVYSSEADKDSAEYLDLGMMSYYFYGEFDIEMPVLELVEEYAMAIPSGLFAFEVNILKAKSTAAANEVKKMMDSRLTIKNKDRGEIENYDAGQLSAFDSAEVWVSGKYVILLASDDNAAIKNVISEMLSSDQASVNNDGTLDKADNNNAEIIQIASSIREIPTDGEGSSVGSSPSSENQSELPQMTVSMFSGNDLVVLGGKCDVGATIHVRGGVMDYTFGTDHGNWICEVQIPTGTSTLYLTQKAPDKEESKPIEIFVQSRTDVDFSSHGACQVAVGDNAQCHFFSQLDDWQGTNLLGGNQIKGISDRVKEKVDYLAGFDCELIYLIVPNPMEVYPETAPLRFERSTADQSRADQFAEAASAAGATVLELTDILTEHRDDEYKIYNKTDSHWTKYGAYWGQYALMEHISQKWEDAKPLEIGREIEFYNKEADGGDMLTHLELDNSLIKEYATFDRWLVESGDSPNFYVDNSTELNYDPIRGSLTKTNPTTGDRELPTAMIIRDSFSTPIYGYLNTVFSEVYWQSMWNYKFDKEQIAKNKPDYYIVLLTERNIENAFG